MNTDNNAQATAGKGAPDGFRGLRRLARAMAATSAGLAWAIRNEEAVRVELIGLVFLVPLGIWLGNTGVERALLVGSLFLVLMIELLNTAIEATVDRIGLERHALSGLAKDMGSAAVFVALLNAAVTWLLVLA